MSEDGGTLTGFSASGRVPDGLIEFIYLLARDHLPAGVIRGIISAHLQAEPNLARDFSDPDLESWAKERAEEIIAIQWPASKGSVPR